MPTLNEPATLAQVNEEIRFLTKELVSLCQQAEKADEDSNATRYAKLVDDIDDRRPVLQAWYRRRRILSYAG